MKKEKIPKVYRIMLHPDVVYSKNDGDRHFISASQLKYLWGVLPSDIVVVYDHKNPLHDDYHLNKYSPDVIHLGPMRDGNYRDIHALDEYEPLPFEQQPKSIQKMFNPKK